MQDREGKRSTNQRTTIFKLLCVWRSKFRNSSLLSVVRVQLRKRLKVLSLRSNDNDLTTTADIPMVLMTQWLPSQWSCLRLPAVVTHCFNRKSGSLTASFFPEPTLEICLARLFFGLGRGGFSWYYSRLFPFCSDFFCQCLPLPATIEGCLPRFSWISGQQQCRQKQKSLREQRGNLNIVFPCYRRITWLSGTKNVGKHLLSLLRKGWGAKPYSPWISSHGTYKQKWSARVAVKRIIIRPPGLYSLWSVLLLLCPFFYPWLLGQFTANCFLVGS